MKKGLVVVAAIFAVVALALWVVSWFRAPGAVASSAARAWPGDLGTLDAVRDRVQPAKGNAASAKLKSLAGSLSGTEAVEAFVAREVMRGELAIGDPPALPDVTPIRELLLRERVVWERAYEIGDAETQTNRGAQMTMARALIATALSKARAKDAAAWEDLRAVWTLARSLDGNPQVMEQTAALSMARMINAVAWKMPLPAPAWLGEVHERDNVRALLDAYQHQTAAYWQDGAELFPTKLLADSVEHDRQIAEAVFKATACDVTLPMNKLGTDLTAVWRRAFRYRAEREASANALRAREGKPIEPASRCSDGAWTFDGTTLRFSRDIPTAPPDTPMPLVLRVAQ